uniref:Uncharacterized protein n=1 Tax=viral metagenome TaxID=1070528 RepID=A0A6M3LWD9_9ZZZZ
MVPYSERRHRLNGVEVDPVMVAVYHRLLRLVEEKEDLLTAEILFRVYYRLKEHVTNRPSYPPHDTWSEISSYLTNGTVLVGEGA